MQYAETYEVAFHFPWDHYAVVIWNRLDAAGTNIPSEEPRLPFHKLLFRICGVNIAAFLHVVNMHVISPSN